ncbi:hypothetical protein [Methanosarcina mazei]|uniref:Uncharacterized protein n=1 Tax=Methanosarcina mazei S-6 TaxID=213585 RepID=A0A0E3RKL7_METMZ|nr:hypothetical protein [Methanosarcina mazei]AKB64932.1 hypothetical protein MSMAS_1736 [Methanosarcina mazei S-6]
MPEKFDRKRVELSFRRFSDFADDVLSSEYSTFDAYLNIFVNHCENDEIMSIICNQLKHDSTILDDWESRNNLAGIIHRVSGIKLTLPTDEKQRDILLYQICLKVNKGETDIFSVYFDFNSCSPDEAVHNFNTDFVKPMVRSIGYKLEEIEYDIETDLKDERYIPITVFYVYQDYSTNITGDVNTKGDAAIGEGANIEKKSII